MDFDRFGQGQERVWEVEKEGEQKKIFKWPTMASFSCYSGIVNNQPAAETPWAFALFGGGRNAEAEREARHRQG